MGAYSIFTDRMLIQKFNLIILAQQLNWKKDLFPVLDIERESSLGRDNLIEGI